MDVKRPPINEVALKGLQTAIVDTVTLITKGRSAGLTFAVASHGPDVDPETEIFKTRVLGIRRARAAVKANEELIDDILKQYLIKGEPGHHGV